MQYPFIHHPGDGQMTIVARKSSPILPVAWSNARSPS
jgi:hypothetical protein